MSPETLLPFLGIALCAVVLVQIGLWSAGAFFQLMEGRKQFQLSQELLRKQIETAASRPKERQAESDDGSWNGFRQFRVARLVKETELCTSVYLQPTDKKNICAFKPGQHLTLKFPVPGQSKPVVRCYSLSQGPKPDEYRISVKAVPSPRDKPEVPPGLVSNFVNHHLLQGDLIDVKAPSGHFHIDTESDAPVVLLAGGIGVTPMISMIDYIVSNQPKRQIIMFYGSRHGADHAFKSYLHQIQEQFANIHIINVYSSPIQSDVPGQDFHVQGFVTPELIHQVLPEQSYQFYMCGPPPFMDSVYNGLIEKGVPESRIHFEAFGPASIGKGRKKEPVATNDSKVATDATVRFAESNKIVNWNPAFENILDAAESNGVSIDSGCRAGSCGTCETLIKSGKVLYPDGQEVDCQPGHCLVCLAKPDGPVELEA